VSIRKLKPPRFSAVNVVAPGILQGVSQNREPVKVPFLVDRPSPGDGGARPLGIGRPGAEGVADDAPEEVRLMPSLLL
jgi:hypothetical protein